MEPQASDELVESDDNELGERDVRLTTWPPYAETPDDDDWED